MSLIKENPFRTLGITADVTERVLQKQIGIIKRFSEIGKFKAFDTDFMFLGDLPRDSDCVHHASGMLEQSHNKLQHALFWFIKDNQFDEIAFSKLQANDVSKAVEIWEKILRGEVTEKNFSAYFNLSTLYIALSLNGQDFSLSILKKGIDLKGTAIRSNHMSSFSETVTNETHKFCVDEVSKRFVDELVELVNPHVKNKNISINDIISLFRTYPDSTQKYIADKFTDLPLSTLDGLIDKTESKRKNNSKNAALYADDLYLNSKKDILLLKNILGEGDVKFQMVASRLAEEILQCAIDFYNELRDDDNEIDPGQDTLRIVKYASSIGATGQVADRISDALETIQEWVDEEPSRNVMNEVSEEIAFITDELSSFQNESPTIFDAKHLITECKPKLDWIERKLGSDNEFYIGISSAVAQNASRMVIAVLNDEQSDFNAARVKQFSSSLSSGLAVMRMMERFTLDADTRNLLNNNIKGIVETNSVIKDAITASEKKAESACYIATMAYGDYDHPQVMLLREFRDNSLSNSVFGRCGIWLYYRFSPYIVYCLKDFKWINNLIRSGLDKFIERIN